MWTNEKLPETYAALVTFVRKYLEIRIVKAVDNVPTELPELLSF